MALDLFKFLKTPEYLQIHSVGVDISNSCIRFIDLKKKNDSFFINFFGEVAVPEGVFNCGQILNKEALSLILSSIRERFGFSFVKVSIPEEKSYIFNIEIPRVSEKEMRSVVEFSLEEFVPIKSDESYFEFMPIRNLPNGNVEVSVSVVPKKIIEDYVETFKKAGLEITSFCNESRRTAKALIDESDQGSFMIVNIKDKNTILSIVEESIVTYTSTISVGTDAVVGKVKDAGISVNKTGCFKLPEKAFSERVEDSTDYLYALANIFSVIRDEIIRLNQFWEGRDENKILNKKIKKIILSGRTSLVPGFSKYLSSSVETVVEVGNVWTNVFDFEKNIPRISFADSLDFASVVGISLPENDYSKK